MHYCRYGFHCITIYWKYYLRLEVFIVTNNSSDYSPVQFNVLSGAASGEINNIVPSTASFVLTSNGPSAQPTFQPSPNLATLTYYLTNTASSVASNLQLTSTPFTPKTTLTFAGLAGGNTELQDWITNAGTPNLSFIPAGTFLFHIHASQSVGTKNTVLFAEFWEASSVGADIAKIGTTETTTVLTGSEVEYAIAFVTSNVYTMGSTASRIKIKVFATVSGGGSAPTALLYVGGTADSHITLPSQTVDATNFVPYTGATTNLNMGTNTITAASITFGAGDPLSTYIASGTFTPTLFGSVSAGTTTYGTQYGVYTQIGRQFFFAVNVVITAATGTGDLQIGNFPVTIANASTLCSTVIQVPTWPVGTTQAMGNPRAGTTFAKILCCGNASAFAFLQMANTSMNITLNGFFSV